MTVRTKLTLMYQILSLIDTGAKPNVINAAFIKPACSNGTKRQGTAVLRTSRKQSLSFMWTILLYIDIDELNGPARFGIFDILAVGLLLGTSFLNHYIQGFFSR